MISAPSVKRPIHEHPLFPSFVHIHAKCSGCHVKELMHGSHFCNDAYCNVWFHKECAEAPSEINHPSHPQHPLLLITNDDDVGDGPCDLCGQKLLAPCYSCHTCEFKLDLSCGIKPSPIAIEHPLCHDHPLVFLKKREEQAPCEVCKDPVGGPSYSCLECDIYFHLDCVYFSKEVNHPCHSNHPLKLIPYESLTDAERICLRCDRRGQYMYYHCCICNFTTCLHCTRNSPPLVIEPTKFHKHPLTLFSRRIMVNCNACGEEDTTGGYFCLQCDFVVHGKCISLPHVININRHNHRISFTHHLGVGYLKCGVCRLSLSPYYGAYTCSVCPIYAVHSGCASRFDVWDGVDLEGIPEDDTEDIASFKVVGDGLICHFSHEEHPLRLYGNNFTHSECIRCAACIHPLGFDSIYLCEERCHFLLHEKCANLPKKRRLVFDARPFTLTDTASLVDCNMCGMLSYGFKYTSKVSEDVDVHCGSLSEPFVHDGHLHPLYFDKKPGHKCDGCEKKVDDHILRCDACDFDLCLYCASLPLKIQHRNDEHPLTLRCGEKASGKNWCDICEMELDLSIWFYTCLDCGVTLHVRCVLGDFSRLMPGQVFEIRDKFICVIPNDRNTRPLCSHCHSRCKASIILHDYNDNNICICSRSCLSSYLGIQF